MHQRLELNLKQRKKDNPGFIETDMTSMLDEAGRARILARSALRRMAQPEDVAATAPFLLGDGGRNVTGAVMTVDAGATA